MLLSKSETFIRSSLAVLLGVFGGSSVRADLPLRITSRDQSGNLAWTNAIAPGICTIESSGGLNGGWTPARNVFSTESAGSFSSGLEGDYFVRLRSVGGDKTVIAGNGTVSGGGDGFPALQTGLNGPCEVWPVPTGGYLFLLHDGGQLWYMDTASVLHLLVNGGSGTTHNGDGVNFYDPLQLKISEGRSVSMDYNGKHHIMRKQLRLYPAHSLSTNHALNH
jgi:hypothetical protein